MTEYSYVRALIDGGSAWDIDNPHRVDGEGRQIHLAKEIEAELPGKVFSVHCNGTSCVVEHQTELSGAEETTQDGVVAAHKANT